MDRTDRELAAWYRLHAQQAPSGPLRDIADPLDFLRFTEMQQWGRIAAEREYRGFRVNAPLKIIPKPAKPVTRRSSSPSVPLGSRSSSSYVTKASASLFPPIDRSDPIEIEGNTVRVYERDGVRHMLLSDYQHQVREQRRG